MPAAFSRRHALAATLALAALARPARADLPAAADEALQLVEAYLNSFRTLRARFEQIAPDGSMATGKVYLKRPGQMRFDYDPPSKVLLVATDWRLIFWDGSINQQNVIPLAQTPLGFLLAERVELGGEVKVTDVVEQEGEIDVTVVRAAEPDQGSVTLVFGNAPVALRRWSVTDPQALVTRVLLYDVELDVPLDASLFRWSDPKIFGAPE
ncbi:MAG: outer membrane lipoprotein carrier protein LolA [Geminicoccaceae bacterium]